MTQAQLLALLQQLFPGITIAQATDLLGDAEDKGIFPELFSTAGVSFLTEPEEGQAPTFDEAAKRADTFRVLSVWGLVNGIIDQDAIDQIAPGFDRALSEDEANAVRQRLGPLIDFAGTAIQEFGVKEDLLPDEREIRRQQFMEYLAQTGVLTPQQAQNPSLLSKAYRQGISERLKDMDERFEAQDDVFFTNWVDFLVAELPEKLERREPGHPFERVTLPTGAGVVGLPTQAEFQSRERQRLAFLAEARQTGAITPQSSPEEILGLNQAFDSLFANATASGQLGFDSDISGITSAFLARRRLEQQRADLQFISQQRDLTIDERIGLQNIEAQLAGVSPGRLTEPLERRQSALTALAQQRDLTPDEQAELDRIPGQLSQLGGRLAQAGVGAPVAGPVGGPPGFSGDVVQQPPSDQEQFAGFFNQVFQRGVTSTGQVAQEDVGFLQYLDANAAALQVEFQREQEARDTAAAKERAGLVEAAAKTHTETASGLGLGSGAKAQAAITEQVKGTFGPTQAGGGQTQQVLSDLFGTKKAKPTFEEHLRRREPALRGRRRGQARARAQRREGAASLLTFQGG